YVHFGSVTSAHTSPPKNKPIRFLYNIDYRLKPPYKKAISLNASWINPKHMYYIYDRGSDFIFDIQLIHAVILEEGHLKVFFKYHNKCEVNMFYENNIRINYRNRFYVNSIIRI
ncbi:hypothetical protein RCO48_22555, partial [Peribacillus frigoritolerans]|nr:hypothetical protein [Peribacillus frigoritolerans]